jgi:hypothetical protein
MALLTIDPRREQPDFALHPRHCFNGASRPVFSAAAALPLDSSCAVIHRTEKSRHHYWSDEPLKQFDF